MRPRERRNFILGYLAGHDRLDLAELGALLGVTGQTLRSELADIESDMGGGRRCFRELSARYVEVLDRPSLTRYLNHAAYAPGEASTEDRVILSLVLSDGYQTMRSLADRLYMSRSNAEKVLARLSREGRVALETSRQKGVRLAMGVGARRDLFVRVLLPHMDITCLEESVRGFHERCFPLMDYLSQDELNRALRFVDVLKRDDGDAYVEDSLAELFCYVLVTCWCIDRGRFIKPEDMRALEGMADTGRYEQVVAACSCDAGMELTDLERRRLAVFLMSLRKVQAQDSTDIVRFMTPLVTDIISVIRERYAIDLSCDHKLVEGLALHVWATVIRGVTLLSQPVLYSAEELKRAYPIGFELATAAAEIIEDKCGHLPNEVEITYLALHLQAALERMGFEADTPQEMRAVIVCHYGLAASNLIAERLERTFPQIKVVGLYSLLEYAERMGDCDVIVSTEPLVDEEHSAVPIVHVTPMLHETELLPLRQLIDRRQQLDSQIAVMILESVVTDLSSCSSDAEAIGLLARRLCEEGCVDGAYETTALERERIAPTNLDYIAIPHGDPAHVIRTRLAIGRAPQGISWQDSTVSLVFMLSFSNDALASNPHLFSTFYRRLARPETEMALKEVARLPDAECRRLTVRMLVDESRGGEGCHEHN